MSLIHNDIHSNALAGMNEVQWRDERPTCSSILDELLSWLFSTWQRQVEQTATLVKHLQKKVLQMLFFSTISAKFIELN